MYIYMCVYIYIIYIYMYTYVYIYIYIYIYIYMFLQGAREVLLVWHYLSNTASFVFYGAPCLTRLHELLFATFEEHMRQTSIVRQVVPPELY